MDRSIKESIAGAIDLLRRASSHLGIDTHKVLTAALALVVFAQFLLLVHAVSRSADTWPVINAYDNDAAFAIRTAERSSWLKDNRFYPYGNLYFNIAHSFAHFDPLAASGPRAAISLDNDQAHHFSLMLVSLLSLYGIAFLVSFLLSGSWPFRLLSLFALVTVLVSSESWTRWVFRVHPDLLFSFLLALALALTVRFLQTGLDGHWYGSAAAWGCALGTKLTAVLFLPGLLLLFLPLVNRASLVNAGRYYGTVLASYLIVGFPQNFRFFGHFRFLKHQSTLSLAPTPASMAETLANLALQALPAIGAVILLRMLANLVDRNAPRPVPPRALLTAAGIIIVPLASLLAQRVITDHEHYTLPVAACLFVNAAFSAVNALRFDRLAPASPALRHAALLLVALVFLLASRSLPNAVPKVLAEQIQGRQEARAFMEEIGQYQRQGLTILADPYVPWDENLGGVSESFFRTPKHLADGKADMVALAKGYYRRYLEDPPSLYVQKDIPGWRDVRDYYLIFAGKERTTDPSGCKWVKVSSHPGGWELWKREQ